MSDTTIYFISPTDGSDSFVIQPKTIDGPVDGSIRQHTDLVLYGNGAENWGEKFNQNFYRLLENFACGNANAGTGFDPIPESSTSYNPYGMKDGVNYPIRGQLWYNTTDQSMHFYTGTEWKPTNEISGAVDINQITGMDLTATPVPTSSGSLLLGYVNGEWVPVTLPTYTNVNSSTDLSDFASTTPTAGQVLTYQNGKWTAANIPAPSVTFASITGTIASNTTLSNAFGAKQNTISGAASTITNNNLTADEILISSPTGKVAASGVGIQKLAYLSGVTSSIQTQLNNKIDASSATLSNVNLTGTPTAPTAAAGTDSTQIATTAFVQDAVAGAASPSFADTSLTGTPTAPTAAAGTDSTQLATTAFVHDAGLGGHNQSYQYLAGCTITPVTRLVNTTYTNTGKSAIYVSVQLMPTSAGWLSASIGVDLTDPTLYTVDQHIGYCANPFTVDPGNCFNFSVASASDIQNVTLQAIVPPGYKYRVNTNLSVATLAMHSWRELR